MYSWYQKRGEMARSWCDKKPPATERRDKRYITFLTVTGDEWQEHMKRQEGEDIDALAVVLVEAKPHQKEQWREYIDQARKPWIVSVWEEWGLAVLWDDSVLTVEKNVRYTSHEQAWMELRFRELRKGVSTNHSINCFLCTMVDRTRDISMQKVLKEAVKLCPVLVGGYFSMKRTYVAFQVEKMEGRRSGEAASENNVQWTVVDSRGFHPETNVMIVTKAWTKDKEDGSMLPRNRLTCANHAVRIVCSRATSEELGSSETEEPGSHSINKAVPSTSAASTLDAPDAMEETMHARPTQHKDWLDDVIALLASLLKKQLTKFSTEQIGAAATAAVTAQDLSDEVARELAELSNHLLFTKEARVKSVERTLKGLQYCHSIRCAVIHGADRQLEHNEVVKCQNIWKGIFLEKELTDRQRHQFRLRYKDDGTCNAVLRERVGNPKLANAIYTHGLPWIMQSGAAGWVSGDDVLHRSLSVGVLWLKNVGQGLVERKKRVFLCRGATPRRQAQK